MLPAEQMSMYNCRHNPAHNKMSVYQSHCLTHIVGFEKYVKCHLLVKKSVNIKFIPVFFSVNNFIHMKETQMNNITVSEASGGTQWKYSVHTLHVVI